MTRKKKYMHICHQVSATSNTYIQNKNVANIFWTPNIDTVRLCAVFFLSFFKCMYLMLSSSDNMYTSVFFSSRMNSYGEISDKRNMYARMKPGGRQLHILLLKIYL